MNVQILDPNTGHESSHGVFVCSELTRGESLFYALILDLNHEISIP